MTLGDRGGDEPVELVQAERSRSTGRRRLGGAAVERAHKLGKLAAVHIGLDQRVVRKLAERVLEVTVVRERRARALEHAVDHLPVLGDDEPVADDSGRRRRRRSCVDLVHE